MMALAPGGTSKSAAASARITAMAKLVSDPTIAMTNSAPGRSGSRSSCDTTAEDMQLIPEIMAHSPRRVQTVPSVGYILSGCRRGGQSEVGPGECQETGQDRIRSLQPKPRDDPT
jgi:hypothetical protein